MGVRKIFIVLVTIVVCVILGAFVLNVIMPNTVTAMVNAVEDTIKSATGMSFDLNGDGAAGTGASTTATAGTYGGSAHDNDNSAQNGAGVQGYQ